MKFTSAPRIRLFPVLGAVVAIAVALPAQAQTMSLVITNSNTNFTDNDIYVSFECGSGVSGIVGTYGGGTPFSVINSATYQYYATSTSTIASTSPQTFAITAPVTLAQLNAGSGMQFTTATSLRAYVSLGQPLVLSSTPVGTPGAWTSGYGQNAAALSFGMPTYANSTADPNWNVRWDIFEFTVTPAFGDQGDSTLINAVGIPMQMTSFSSGTVVQSVKATSDFQTLRTQLQAYQAANAGNNAANLPTYVTTSGSFVRVVGINNGSQAIGTGSSVTPSTWVVSSSTAAGQQAQIGANASFGPYVNAISTGSVTTPLKMDNVVGSFGFTGTLSAAPWTQSGQTLTATWPRLSSGTVAGTVSGTLTSVTTGGTGAALRVTGQFRNGATSVGTYTVTLPPDNVSASGTNFLQSATIYAGDPLANYGLIFEYTPVSTGSSTTYYLWQDFTNAVDLDTGNNGQALIKQVFHDASGGLNFGLVGSNEIDVLSGTTFNAIGSEGWTQWETIKNLGTVTTTTGTWSYTGDAGTQNPGAMPLYQNQWGEAAGFYNQWAKIIYDSSVTAYGNPYSDYLQQVDVNVLTAPNTSAYNIDYVQVTILPDTAVVPEPSAVALVIAAGATLGGIEWRRRRRRSSRREASVPVLPRA